MGFIDGCTDGYKVDFHIHTNFSDGQTAPSDIVQKAKELGYDMIAITDHDGVDGISEAVEAGKTADLKVIPGIELATEIEEGIGLHILGYGIDISEPRLRAVLDDLAERREKRNEQLLQILNDMGYDISYEDLHRQQPNGFIGKPIFARALAAKGYVAHYKDAFKGDRFLGSKEARQAKKVKIMASEAIELIKGAGGIAVLAHPIQTRGAGETGSEEFYGNIEIIIKRLKSQGLEGLECYHPDQNSEQSARFVEMAEKYGLHITRGSDFHGLDFADAALTAKELA